MPKSANPGAPSALVIPFPRYTRPRHRRIPANWGTPDFEAGFEAAMLMMQALRGHDLISHLKGA